MQPNYWRERNKDDIENSHTDWLCRYEVLEPLIKPLAKRARAAALVIGSGTSRFPEHLYDSGFKEVVVVDSCPAAMEHVRGRNNGAGRVGLTTCIGDVCEEGGPQLKDPSLRFDLVVDKGTLDILLVTEDGWLKARKALEWMYGMMRTPGSMILVSHSPPHDRLDMLESVYWHEIQFKMVAGTTIEQMMAHNPYTEKMVDYPYAVAGHEEKQARRLAETAAILAKTAPPASAKLTSMGSPLKSGASTRSQGTPPKGGAGGGDPAAAPGAPLLLPRPEGELGFAAGTAYVYLLEK